MKLGSLEQRYLAALGLVSGLAIGLVVIRWLATDSSRYLFLVENLFLAWLPLILTWLMVRELSHRRWLSWTNLSLTILWLIFLPNSWYLLTDFIHLRPTGEINLLYDIVTVSSAVIAGFALGFTSLYLMHRQLLRRLSAYKAYCLILLVLLLSSFAIYLGRDLRWSTWDILANPSGLVLNISDRVIDPLGHVRAINVTALFFILLSCLYTAIWLLLRPAGQPVHKTDKIKR